jgi:hypothetical protein
MNKKFLISWLIVFVVWMAGSFVVHGMLLNASYAELPNLFRTEEESGRLMHLMLLAHIVMAAAFVWIYDRGCEPKPWLAQGLRFGAAIALLGPIPMYTIYYVVQPLTKQLAVGQIFYESLLVLILGIAVAFLYRDKPAL